MKKYLLFVWVFISCTTGSWANVDTYNFASSIGTYTPLASETILWAGVFNENISASIPIPAFTMAWSTYTNMYVTSNGYITLGTTAAPTLGYYTAISGPGTYDRALAPFCGRLSYAESGSPKISYNTNDAGEIVVQWQDVKRFGAAFSGQRLSFQLRMNPVTGTIRFVYGGTITGSAATTNFQVGLRGSTNADYNNRTTTTNWSATTAGGTNAVTCPFSSAVLPSDGLTFTFTACNAITTFPFTESFDGTTFAPGCWTNINTAGPGAPGTWNRQTAGVSPVCSPHSGAAMARFASWDYGAGTTGILATPPLALPSDQYEVHFWMYRDNGAPTGDDRVNVYCNYNLSPCTTGAFLLGTVHRYWASSPAADTANRWREYIFNMPTGYSGYAYIVFEGVSQFGNNIYIDDVKVKQKFDCPAGSTAESESCSSTLNDGCTMATPAFEPITPGETVCGTVWCDGIHRDTDWYSFTLTETSYVKLTVSAEFPVRFGFVNSPCPQSVYFTYMNGEPFAVNSLDDPLSPGTYYAAIRPVDLSTIIACGGENRYWVKMETFPCPPGSVAEQEVCGANSNGGCTTDSPAFEPIGPGETICGTLWCDGIDRDTDWFTFTLTETTDVTIDGSAQFPVVFGFVNSPCPQTTFISYVTGDPNVPCSLTAILAAGTYYVVAMPLDWTPIISCGGDNRYWLKMEPPFCPPGSTAEQEPCGEDTNGGCHPGEPTPACEPIGLGETKCGTAWTSPEGYLDFDFYSFTLTHRTEVILTAKAEFPFTICMGPSCYPWNFGQTISLTPGLLSRDMTLEAGTNYAVIYANTPQNNPCGNANKYWVTLSPCSIEKFPFWESFDGEVFAPPCWTNAKTAGASTPGTWDRQTTGTDPTCMPHSGNGMARFNCWNYLYGTTGILVTPQLALPSDQYEVHFWMFRDIGFPESADHISVYYNTIPNTTGGTLLGTVNRWCGLPPVTTNGNQWNEYTFSMPAGSSGNAYIIFEGVSEFGSNMFIDDVEVKRIFNCPAGSTAETEPCGQDLNGGCSMVTPAFETLAPGETKCGTAWCNGITRDTDWYTFTLTETTFVKVSVSAEFPVAFGFLDSPCPQEYYLTNTGGEANTVISLADPLPPGTYYIDLAPRDWSTIITCGEDDHYWIKMETSSCPPGSNAEQEVCGAKENDGCNMATPAFEPIALGETKCGIAWSNSGNKDTDWYTFTLAGRTEVTLTAQAEFPLVAGFLNSVCPQGLFIAYNTAAANAPVTVTTILDAGTYYLYISQNGPDDNICGSANKYWVTLTNCKVETFPFRESFEGETFPPLCWKNENTAGPGVPGTWDRQTVGIHPNCFPLSGNGMARFNCWDYHTGTAGILVTPQLSLPNDRYEVHFWMCRDGGTPTHDDRVEVFYNTNPDLTGATLIGTVHRLFSLAPPEPLEGWYEYIFSMPAGSAGDAYIVFKATSDFGSSIFLDEIKIKIIFNCPVPSSPEFESCGQDLNGGCNRTPPAFEPIALGETICGNTWCDGINRDQDWFDFTLAETTTVTLTGSAEVPVLMGLMASPCPQGSFIISKTAPAHSSLSLMTTLAPGTYYAVAEPMDLSTVIACLGDSQLEDNKYWLKISGSNCFHPSDVNASLVTATTATVSWTAPSPAPASGYRYEIRTSGAPGSGGTGLVVVGTKTAGILSAAISGLTPGTTYFAYVRSNCGGGDISPWTAPVQFTTPVISVNTNVPATLVTSGQSFCYDALQTITAGGNPPAFVVNTGGSATMIAGLNIHYLTGSRVAQGGYLHAYIAPGGPFCVVTPMVKAGTVEGDEIPAVTEKSFFRIYPNPTTGNFILEQKGEMIFGQVRVEIYGMHGDKILATSMIREKKHEFSLTGMPAGLYFVKIIAGDRVETIKLIKTM